jgi:hypothetical protein
MLSICSTWLETILEITKFTRNNKVEMLVHRCRGNADGRGTLDKEGKHLSRPRKLGFVFLKMAPLCKCSYFQYLKISLRGLLSV